VSIDVSRPWLNIILAKGLDEVKECRRSAFSISSSLTQPPLNVHEAFICRTRLKALLRASQTHSQFLQRKSRRGAIEDDKGCVDEEGPDERPMQASV
jgi:hypothetical protein